MIDNNFIRSDQDRVFFSAIDSDPVNLNPGPHLLACTPCIFNDDPSHGPKMDLAVRSKKKLYRGCGNINTC